MSLNSSNWYEWLPASWDEKKLKYVVDLRNEKYIGEEIKNYIGLENIESKTGRYIPSTDSEVNIEGISNRFYKGDILFGKLRPYLAKCIEAEFDGVGTTELLVLKTDDRFILTKYLQLMILSPKFIDNINSSTYGTKMPRASWNFIGDIELPLPSVTHQQVIADYVTAKVSGIDKFINQKEKLIMLLEQQRQSIITEAVTKGLNPSAKMKDSGVEWIGEIPEHWIKTKFKYITNKIIDGTHSTPSYTENGVPFLRVTDITQSKGKEINLENVKYISEEEHLELVKRCNPEKGDLLVSKNGTIGIPKVITWDWEFSIFVSLCLIKLKQDKINPFFTCYFFESDLVEEQIAFGTKKSTIMNLHLEKVKEFFVFLPPLEEQLNIIEYLNEKAGEYSNLIDIQNKQIQKLTEYRQSLIYEAVTGKIDVRELNLDEAR